MNRKFLSFLILSFFLSGCALQETHQKLMSSLNEAEGRFQRAENTAQRESSASLEITGKPWLGTTLTVKSSKLLQDDAGEVIRPGLPASGMFLINPPHTLKAALKDALPQMVELLGQDSNAAFSLESGGG